MQWNLAYYVSITEKEVLRYVLFDIEDDTLLAFGRLILRQVGKGGPDWGVLIGPIGGNLVLMEVGNVGVWGV